MKKRVHVYKGEYIKNCIRTLVDIQRWDLILELFERFNLVFIIKDKKMLMEVFWGEKTIIGDSKEGFKIVPEKMFNESIKSYRKNLFQKSKKNYSTWILKYDL